MCRYAVYTYKHHYVCFDCRKTFKQYPAEDLIIRDGHWDIYRQAYLAPSRKKAGRFRDDNPKLMALLDRHLNRTYTCPQCTRPMHNLGRDFKAPALHKIKEWEIIRSLYRAGFAFQTCGCNGPGFIPRKMDDHREYLLQTKAVYEIRLRQTSGRTPAEKAEYSAYWQQRLRLIQTELDRLPR